MHTYKRTHAHTHTHTHTHTQVLPRLRRRGVQANMPKMSASQCYFHMKTHSKYPRKRNSKYPRKRVVNIRENVSWISYRAFCICLIYCQEENLVLSMCLICMPHMYALYVCLTCVPYMYASYVCLICMPHMYASYVCLTCVPYMYASYVCLICMHNMYASYVCLTCVPYMYALYVCLIYWQEEDLVVHIIGPNMNHQTSVAEVRMCVTSTKGPCFVSKEP